MNLMILGLKIRLSLMSGVLDLVLLFEHLEREEDNVV